jgi:ferredoxin
VEGHGTVSVPLIKSFSCLYQVAQRDFDNSIIKRPAYSRRSGICQTCSTKITAGQVDYLEAPMATPEAGEALLCCFYPKLANGDDEVVLDF